MSLLARSVRLWLVGYDRTNMQGNGAFRPRQVLRLRTWWRMFRLWHSCSVLGSAAVQSLASRGNCEGLPLYGLILSDGRRVMIRKVAPHEFVILAELSD